MNLTKKTLVARLAYWQKRLRVQDWKVVATIARYTALPNNGLGHVIIGHDKREAYIRVLCAEDARPYDVVDMQAALDWELTVVHELLHLHFHDVLPDDLAKTNPKSIAMERAIDQIAHALVER